MQRRVRVVCVHYPLSRFSYLEKVQTGRRKT